jgi:ComF family protein
LRLARALSFVRAAPAHVLDVCYPPSCAHCDAACDGGQLFCGDCEGLMRSIESPACAACGLPLHEPDAPCPWCKGKGRPHLDRVARLAEFADPLKGLIHRMKYRHRWPLAEQLADRLLARSEPAKALLNDPTVPGDLQVLVPVPLHWWRQVGRGYNQADVIARRLGRTCGLPVARPAVRVRRTPTQTDLHSRKQREDNLRGAFALVRPAAVAGKHVVIVDDVMTTGATVLSLARALLPAKPASLSAVVVAIADPKHKDFEVL